ncbi:hypothetical protein SCACP_27400 [Sporomusa carbonis]|uniref:acyl-CoA dehydratase activase-related protein n=1 Tax=Sporomusa carbonis TaxID=3076075 RepID=UPI003A75B314
MVLAVRIGLPRGLLYYQYGLVWENFLRELGAEVVVAGDTTKATLDHGSVLDEVCLPVKVYFGHVYELYKKVDYLFSPRVISVAAGQYTCPKIIGMPDMLRSNIDNLPPVINVNVNLRQNNRSLYEAIVSVGRTLGRGAIPSLYAWYRAWKHRHQLPTAYQSDIKRQRIGLIGHSYIIYDRQISMNIINKLRDIGFDVITPEMVSNRQATAAAKVLGKKIFWSNSHHMAGAALALMQSAQPVNGLIFMTSFSCGPDALIGELINQRAQSLNIPCLLLTVDEHTAEAGFITRLEAFTDMLVRRKRS